MCIRDRIASETSQTMRVPNRFFRRDHFFYQQLALSSFSGKVCRGLQRFRQQGVCFWKTGSWIRNQERSHTMHCPTCCFGPSIIFELQSHESAHRSDGATGPSFSQFLRRTTMVPDSQRWTYQTSQRLILFLIKISRNAPFKYRSWSFLGFWF